MKSKFTKSINKAFLSFCILSFSAIEGLSAQNNVINLYKNDNSPAGSQTFSARFKPSDSLKAIKYVNQIGGDMDFASTNLNPQNLQFNINQGDLGELYKLLDLYKSEAGKGHSIIILTRKSQTGKVVDSFPDIRKYVVGDDLGGYTQAQTSVEPPIIGGNLKFVSEGENPFGTNLVFLDQSSVIQIDPNLSNEVSLYPNPAQNFITVDLGNISGTSISICNIQGKLVKSIVPSFDNRQLKIDIADLSTGFYILNVNTQKGQAVKKFAKN